MARITALLVTLLLAGVAHAQRDFTAQKNSAGANAGQATKQAMNGKPPELWGHWIGQTVPEFFTAEGMTPEEYCAHRTVPGSGRHKVYLCSWPRGIKKGSVTPDMTVAFGDFTPQGEFLTNRWAIFKAGRVAEIDAQVNDFGTALADVTAKFGKPTTLDYGTLENGYGATWQVGTAVWVIGDIGIRVRQTPLFGDYTADVSMQRVTALPQRQNMFEK